MIYLALSGILGFLAVTIIDRIWFMIDYKKAERGLESLEHYHYGMALMGAGALLWGMIPDICAFFVIGAGGAFVYHEAKQKNLFSYSSSHFTQSTLIAFGILCGMILSYMAKASVFIE